MGGSKHQPGTRGSASQHPAAAPVTSKPGHPTPTEAIVGLQRLAGNRAVAGLVSDQGGPSRALLRAPVKTKPSRAANPRTIVMTVIPPREMDGREFEIFVLQRLYDEATGDAEARLTDWEANGLGSQGHFKTGIHGDEVGKPLVVGVTPPRPSTEAAEAMQIRQQDFADLERDKQRQINDEADRRYWEKVGDRKHKKLGTVQGEQGQRELWMQTRAEVMRDRDQVEALPGEARDFLAPDTGDLRPEDYKAGLRIGEAAKGFTTADWARYERNAVGTTTDYEVAEESVKRFAKKLEDEKQIAERIRGTEMLFRGEHAQRAAHEPGYPEDQVRLWLPTTKFKTIEEYDAACDAYLKIFRERAVEIAFLALQTSERVVGSELARYNRPDEREALVKDLDKYRELVRQASYISYPEQGPASRRPSGELGPDEKAAWDAVDRERSLQAVLHPVVKDDDLSMAALAYASPDELGEMIRSVSVEHLDAIAKSRARLARDPEAVFQFGNVIAATKKEMGAEDGVIHELIVDEHLRDIRKDHELRSLGMMVLAIGLGILTFGTGTVAVVASTALLAQGVYMGVEEVKAYGDAYAAAHTAFDAAHSLSSDSPSAFWAAFALITAGLDGINLVNALKAAAEPLSVLEATQSLKQFDASLLEVTEHLPDELRAALTPAAKTVLKRALRAKVKLDKATRAFGQAFKAADTFGPGGALSANAAKELSRCGYLGAQMGMRDFAEFAAFAQTGPLRKLNFTTLSHEELDSLKQAFAAGVREAEEKGVALAPSSLKPNTGASEGEPSVTGEPAPAGEAGPTDEPVPEAAGEPPPEPPRVPVNAKHPTVASLRSAAEKDLAKLGSGTGAGDLNREWLRIQDDLATLPDTPANNWIKERLQKVFEGRRSPSVILDEMADIWEGAAADGITTTEELVKRAGRGQKLRLMPPRQLPPEEFAVFLRERAPRIDTYFSNQDHGAYTHVFDDMIVARVLGGRDDALIFRRMLTEVTHPNDTVEYPLWAKIWDALFDEYMGPQINRPEDLGPILHNHLGIDLQPPRP